MGEDICDPLLCSVCAEPATRYIGKLNVLPICDNPVCYTTRIEEVNKMIMEMNKEMLEAAIENTEF